LQFLTTGDSSLAGLSFTSDAIGSAAAGLDNEAVGTIAAAAAVPEPGTFLSIAAGLIALQIAVAARRRRHTRARKLPTA
jgi:hypothetical protein